MTPSPSGTSSSPSGTSSPSGRATGVTLDDVHAAASRIAGRAHRTPVMTSRRIDAELGCQVFFKCENLQCVGAFKFRGAFNALSRLDDDARRAGVVAYSSGNHAQAVARSAQILGIPATMVMPTDAPAVKLAATRGYGARIVSYDREREDREAIGARLAAERGLTLIPPYDHPDIIAGQGTAALELHEQAPELDVVVAPLGGGGLLGGTAVVTRALRPDADVYGAEPAAGDDGKQSFDSGRIVHIPTPRTIADGAQTQHLGELTFPIIRTGVRDIVTVTDDELVRAMRALAVTLKLVVEPTGALGMAALHHLDGRLTGRRVGVILSGGNIDVTRFAELVGGPS